MNFPSIKALDKWVADIGVSTTTVWNWRKAGIIKTHNLHGKLYITAEEAERFVQRLKAGEFAKDKKVPPPPLRRKKRYEWPGRPLADKTL